MCDPGGIPRAVILLTLLFLPLSAARPQGPQAHIAPVATGSVQPPTHRTPSEGSVDPAVPVFISSSAADFFHPGFQTTDTLTPDSAWKPRSPKSSWTAIGLSAALPGAGQVYTGNYWKVPVIWGLGGYWIYEWTSNNKLYKQYRDEYNQSLVDSPPNGDNQLLTLREAYKDQRDSFAWYLGLLYFLNVVDAYVGAELYDFDVGPDLGAGGSGVQVNLRIHL